MHTLYCVLGGGKGGVRVCVCDVLLSIGCPRNTQLGVMCYSRRAHGTTCFCFVYRKIDVDAEFQPRASRSAARSMAVGQLG
jgi:hypothetical protein